MTSMNGGQTFQQIELILRDVTNGDKLPVYIDVFDNSLSHKWLQALEHAVEKNLHLEKNFCFLGWPKSPRDGEFILDQVNQSITAINQARLGYQIDDYFSMENTMSDDPQHGWGTARNIIHDKFNQLHRYFEDLQGVSGRISPYYQRADAATRWHIRQLNLLCHEFETWALSWRKQLDAPDWIRPSQLMCWLHAPRFDLDEKDYELFGIDTLNRSLGGVFVGVNKAVGKHHWEVFNDEGRDSRIDELTTTTLRNQTEAAADFDIEWGQDPRDFHWQKIKLDEFRTWLTDNGFDPEDLALTIGHPKVAQVDLQRSFGTDRHSDIWTIMNQYLDVWSININGRSTVYDYHWQDRDFATRQMAIIEQEKRT